MNMMLTFNLIFLWIISLLNLLLLIALIRRMNKLPINFADNSDLLKPGIKAPNFSAKKVFDGALVTLEDFSNKPLLLIFTSSSCSVCRKEIVNINRLSFKEDIRKKNLVIVNLEDEEKTQDFIDEFTITLPILSASPDSNTIITDFNIRSIPSYCFILDGLVKSSGLIDPNSNWVENIHIK